MANFSHGQLVIPKFHGAKLTDIPDEDLLEILVSGKQFNLSRQKGCMAE